MKPINGHNTRPPICSGCGRAHFPRTSQAMIGGCACCGHRLAVHLRGACTVGGCRCTHPVPATRP